MTELDRDRKYVQIKSRKLRNGYGLLAHLQAFFQSSLSISFRVILT